MCFMKGELWYLPPEFQNSPEFPRIPRIPCIGAMVENIEGSDDHPLVRVSLSVLGHVLGGKQHTVELLGKLNSRARDRKSVKGIDDSIEYVSKEWSGEDPLY